MRIEKTGKVPSESNFLPGAPLCVHGIRTLRTLLPAKVTIDDKPKSPVVRCSFRD